MKDMPHEYNHFCILIVMHIGSSIDFLVLSIHHKGMFGTVPLQKKQFYSTKSTFP